MANADPDHEAKLAFILTDFGVNHLFLGKIFTVDSIINYGFEKKVPYAFNRRRLGDMLLDLYSKGILLYFKKGKFAFPAPGTPIPQMTSPVLTQPIFQEPLIRNGTEEQHWNVTEPLITEALTYEIPANGNIPMTAKCNTFDIKEHWKDGCKSIHIYFSSDFDMGWADQCHRNCYPDFVNMGENIVLARKNPDTKEDQEVIVPRSPPGVTPMVYIEGAGWREVKVERRETVKDPTNSNYRRTRRPK
jgi:hypothetical protein